MLLNRDCFKSINRFWVVQSYLTILILPIQEHSVSFHLFLLSWISFLSILQFSEYRSFTFLDQFIPRYFILFDAMVNGIISLISLSDLSLLVYRKARYFCLLILYPATLPNALMSSSSFLVASSGFSIFGKLSSGHRTGKGQFSFQFQRKAMPRISKLPYNCTSFTGQQDYAQNPSRQASAVHEP